MKNAVWTACLLCLSGCAQVMAPAPGADATSHDASAAPLWRQATSASTDMQRWHVDGVHLSYQDTGGDKPVVLCLHAIGHGAGDYVAVVAALRERYRLIVLDWPGQGRSDAMAITPDVNQYALLVARLVSHLSLGRVHIIGNSVGAGAALLYASQHPAQVRSLVVSNPAGLDQGGVLGRIFTWWMAKRFDRASSNPAAFASWFNDYYNEVLPMPAAASQRAKVVAAGHEVAPLLAAAWRGFAQPQNDLRGLMAGLHVPVLVAWAERDKVVSWSRNRAGIAALPNHRVEFFAAGHTPFLEQPEHYLRVLTPFLASAD
jgi:pimeloyl-ACP methyl ester carboxylesterase